MSRASREQPRLAVLFLSIIIAAAAATAAFGGTPQSSEKSAPAKHLVGEAEMRASAAAAVSVRDARLAKVARVLNTGEAKDRLARWGISPERVAAAVGGLDDAELAYLAAQSDAAMAGLEGSGPSLWLWAALGAAVVLGICAYLLATTEY